MRSWWWLSCRAGAPASCHAPRWCAPHSYPEFMKVLSTVIALTVFLSAPAQLAAQQTNPNNRKELRRIGLVPDRRRVGHRRRGGGARRLGNASLSAGGAIGARRPLRRRVVPRVVGREQNARSREAEAQLDADRDGQRRHRDRRLYLPPFPALFQSAGRVDPDNAHRSHDQPHDLVLVDRIGMLDADSSPDVLAGQGVRRGALVVF